jgi:cholesterol transport system auxiliary component
MHIAKYLVLSLCFLTTSACALLGAKKPDLSVYTLQRIEQSCSHTSTLARHLLIATPVASDPLSSTRIALQPSDHIYGSFKSARWSAPAPELIQSLLIQVFENCATDAGIARAEVGIDGDFLLDSELNAFQADYREQSSSNNHAIISLSVRLIDASNRRIISTQTFNVKQLIQGHGLPAVVNALEQSLNQIANQIVAWTDQEIQNSAVSPAIQKPEES